MSQASHIGQARTYWAVCDARLDNEWFPLKWVLGNEEEGQRSLRWLRQWYPNAFLVAMAMTTLADNFQAPPLPTRKNATIQISPEPHSTAFTGLRLVK